MIAKSKPNSKPQPLTLADAMRSSMLQIWQAGLGAFSRTRSEGGEAFAKLVNDGAQLQDRTRDLACAGASEIADSAKKIVGDAGKQASESLSKVETRLEKGVADALHTLGVPVRKDLHALIERIEKLSASIETLTSQRKRAVSTRAAAGPSEIAPRTAEKKTAKGKIQVPKLSPKALGKRARQSVSTRP